MGDQQWIAGIRDDGGELVRHSEPALGLPQQHHASIRSDAPAVESSGDRLAANGWEREREKAIFDRGGCGFDAAEGSV
jgi:hypothetical protein